MPRVMMLSLTATGTPASGAERLLAVDRARALERAVAGHRQEGASAIGSARFDACQRCRADLGRRDPAGGDGVANLASGLEGECAHAASGSSTANR